jgi:glycosyltransferase involved in cell wall biosynthesis
VTAEAPLVTVTIPTFERPDLLSESLASVLGQTLSNIEVIVSDNGAQAETEAVVASFGDPRVSYAPLEENIGPFGNVSRCLRLGTAPYIAILHDDDLLMPTSLERRLERLESDPSLSVVNTAHSVIDGDGRVLRPDVNWSLAEGDWEMDGEAFLRRAVTAGVAFHLSTALSRRSVVEDEAFDPAAAGYCDVAVWLRVASRGARFAYIDEPLSAIREHAASDSTRLGLHVTRDSTDGDAAIDTQTLEQVRQMQAVRREFLEREGRTLPDRDELWAAARRDARKRMARVIVKEALNGGSFELTVSRLREASAIDPRMAWSVWAPAALIVALGGRPAWRVISTLAAPARRYWA